MYDFENKSLLVKTVTVVGANGTMGRNVSAIFASFGNAKVNMVSRSIEKSENAIEKAYQSVRAESIKKNMYAADYSMLDDCVAESDIVFESTAENWEVKSAITKQIAESAKRHFKECRSTIFCTGSSGLSISDLSKLFPEELQENYMGIHMFNPPYSMTLCEMTPTEWSNRTLFEAAMKYCNNVLLRTVVEVKDSPAFLGNRIGFQFINSALQYADRYADSGGIDYIDAILGPFIGRNMAPLVTSDFVGLDVHKAIVDNIFENTNDYAHDDFIFPDFANVLVREGHLGKKSGGGLYKTELYDNGEKVRLVYDIGSGIYRPVMQYSFTFSEKMINFFKDGDYDKGFHVLIENHSIEAEICCKFLLNYVLYALEATELVGYNILSADDVMAAGFNWCPPLAIIQAFGGENDFVKLCKDRVDASILDQIDLERILWKVGPSKYDYRRYVRAKR